MPDLIDIFPRNQKLSEAGPDLQFNYETINDIFGINHVNFDNGAQQGKHSEVDLLSQAAVPAAVANFITMANVPDALGNLFLYFVKQASTTKMELKIYNTPGVRTMCIRLPSRIILKWSLIAGTLDPGDTGLITTTWRSLTNNGTQDIPFAAQLWANVWFGTAVAGGGGNQVDNPGWPYVENISIPTEIKYRVWTRAGFDSHPAATLCIVNYMAIGV